MEKMEGEKESVLLSIEKERLGRLWMFRKESDLELFGEMLTPT